MPETPPREPVTRLALLPPAPSSKAWPNASLNEKDVPWHRTTPRPVRPWSSTTITPRRPSMATAIGPCASSSRNSAFTRARAATRSGSSGRPWRSASRKKFSRNSTPCCRRGIRCMRATSTRPSAWSPPSPMSTSETSTRTFSRRSVRGGGSPRRTSRKGATSTSCASATSSWRAVLPGPERRISRWRWPWRR